MAPTLPYPQTRARSGSGAARAGCDPRAGGGMGPGVTGGALVLERDPLPDEDQVRVLDAAAVGCPDRAPATRDALRRRDLAQRVAGLHHVRAGAGRAGAHGGVGLVVGAVVLLRVVLLVRRAALVRAVRPGRSGRRRA